MKQAYLLFLVLLLLLCGACTAADPPTPILREADLDQQPEPVAEDYELPQTEPLLPLILPEQVETLSGLTPTRQAATILPLTDSPLIYAHCIIGEVAFVDLQGQRIPLPPDVVSYYAIGGGNALGYALLNAQDKYALMDNRGNLVSDFLYDPYYEADSYAFYGAYHYVVVTRLSEGEEYRAAYGLYDLESRQELLAVQYDDISCYAKHIIARQGDLNYIFNYQGNLVFETSENLHELSARNRGSNFWTSGYYYALSGDALYYYEAENRLMQYDDLQIVFAQDGSMTVSIFDTQGRHLYSGSYQNYYEQDGQLLLYGQGELRVIGAAGIVDSFSGLPADLPYAHMRYEGDSLFFSYHDGSTYQKVRYDRQGQELSRESGAQEDGHYGNLTIRFAPSYGQQLTDDDGNIIIPFGRYDYIREGYAPFLIGTSMDSWDNQFDILNAQGEVLLHNPLGATFRQGVAGDSMIVWLDEETCILLHIDGSQQPIADPPAVELVYFGG